MLVQIIDVQRGVSVMDTEVPLDKIGTPQYPEGEEIEITTPIGEKDPSAPRLVIKLAYQLNNVYRLKKNIEETENQIREDVQVLQQVKVFIGQLRGPFGFLSYDVDQAEKSIYAEEEAEAAEEKNGDHARY